MGILGSLVIELAANTARLQSDLGKGVAMAEKAAAKFKTAFQFAGGGLIGAALIGAAKQSIQFGDDINKAAIKAGIGGKAMSELAYAAKMADVDIASLSTAIKKMQVSLSEAASGAKAPNTALAALGLTINDLQKRKPDAQFEVLAQRISELKDPADRARAAVELFGKAGADLLPLFEQGAAGIAKARAEAQKLGLSFTDEQIQRLATADDSIKRLDASWKGFATTLTAWVAPALSTVFDAISGLDTRSLDDQIGALERKIEGMKNLPAGYGQDKVQAELEKLRARRESEAVKAAQTGTFGGPTGRRSYGSPIGYAAATAEEEAKKAAEKVAEIERKANEKRVESYADTLDDMNDLLLKQGQEAIDEDVDNFWKGEQEKAEAARDLQEKIEAFREEQNRKLSANAQVFKDAFLNAWDDMVNTGKFKWDELLKYMIAEFAKRGIAQLFDTLFLPKEGGGKGLGGFFDKIGGWFGGSKSGNGFMPGEWSHGQGGLGGIFGGIGRILGFAKGGYAAAGRPRIVGENGPELEVPNYGATIFPNSMLGGSSYTFAPVTTIDARGATVDVIRVLPGILRRRDEQLKAEFVRELTRQRWGRR